MGESSPKFLRGDLMSDVIFNGSLQRKPVGVASVEIILDNQTDYLKGDYIAKWEHPTLARPTQVQLDAITE